MEYDNVPQNMHSKYTKKTIMFTSKIIFWPITNFGNKTTPGFETLLGQDCRFGRWVSWFSQQKNGGVEEETDVRGDVVRGDKDLKKGW